MATHTDIDSQIEALLFIAAKPLTVKKLSDLVSAPSQIVTHTLERLHKRYTERGGGIRLIKSGTSWEMVTSDDVSEIVASYVKQEVSGELTKPSLETLAIVAYRGPLTRAEIEHIRGVNCSVILRNLLIRGLVEEMSDKKKLMPAFQVLAKVQYLLK